MERLNLSRVSFELYALKGFALGLLLLRNVSPDANSRLIVGSFVVKQGAACRRRQNRISTVSRIVAEGIVSLVKRDFLFAMFTFVLYHDLLTLLRVVELLVVALSSPIEKWFALLTLRALLRLELLFHPDLRRHILRFSVRALRRRLEKVIFISFFRRLSWIASRPVDFISITAIRILRTFGH